MQRWASPTPLHARDGKQEKLQLNLKCKIRNQVQETLLDLLQWMKFQHKEREEKSGKNNVFALFL